MSRAAGPLTATTAREVLSYAENKARYGRKTWVVWEGEAGLFHAEPFSKSALVRAIRHAGRGMLGIPLGLERPNSRFWVVEPTERTLIDDWWMALNILRQRVYFGYR